MARGAVGAHVLRLLLGPHELLERGIAADELGELVDGERVQLLEPRDGDLRRPVAGEEVVVELSRADDEPAHLGHGRPSGRR